MALKLKKGTAMEVATITSLIDCVFFLLIFFVLATRFEEEEKIAKEMEINLAIASAAGPLTAPPKEIVVSFDAKGTYIVENKVVTLSQMLSALKAAAEANPTQSVLVRADRGCSWEQGVAVMNSCRQAGLRVRIATAGDSK
ncbi:MAG: biopolymer transporter ExbD [Planctomycetia bacterium]|nr:biopolymer transporter ExbD [Planctomycetia bacterium]